MSNIFNPPAPGVPYYTPAQYPPAGTASEEGSSVPTLFKPIKIRGVEFPNRIWVSPMCQYSADDGKLTDWHLAHLGGIFTRGPGLTVVEATSVTPEGRITPEDSGLWNDEQIEPLQRIVQFAHSQNQKIAIQLAHAGRKASTVAPWLDMGATATEAVGGWPDDVLAPSAIPYNDAFPKPKELDKESIKRIVTAFARAAKRALKAGFDVIEIHNAHGYLLDSFISPATNKRTDEYGGSFENRIRLTLEIVDAVRAVIPPDMPLFLRISATDWLEESLPNEPSWRSEDTVRLAGILAEHGVDLLDVSTGGLHPQQKIKGGPAYQAPFAEAVKKAHGDKILVGTVGNITDGKTAQSVLDKGQADVVFVGRQFQKNPGTVWAFAEDLGITVTQPHQIDLSIPNSTDGGTTTGTATPTTGQSFAGQSWSTADSTLVPDGDKESQLHFLSEQLKVEKRIKDGAENLLQMDLNDALRSQVESELATAKKKIQVIQKSMDSVSGRSVRKRSTETNGSSKRKFTGQPLQSTSGWKEEGSERDDFRTAMHQANSTIKALLHLSRQNTYNSHPSSSAGSPSTSPSTSTLPNPATASESELNRSRIEHMAKLIGLLQRNLRVKYELDVGEVVHAVLPSLADRASKQARATAYRLIRHALVDSHSVRRLGEQNLDWYIVKSLSRDNKFAVEKEQVIKLIRTVVDIGSERHSPNSATGSGTVPLSDAVMRALIAVAEYPEDPFKPICVETLTEILLIDIELMARTGGIRVLLHALSEGPMEMAPLLAAAFLHIIDSPKTRVYLHPGIDLEIALSGITDAYGRGPEHKEKMKGCSRIVSMMLRTWSGLMYCCINDMAAIRGVIDCLRIPSLETREIILDMFFDLLNIKPPEWHRAFIDGRRLTTYRRSRQSADLSQPQPEIPHKPQDTLKLTDQYIALLILVFSKAGLLDALTSMCEESSVGSALSRKATLLMAEILQKANRVLPLSIAAKIQALPRVFSMASDYNDNEHRIVGSSALSAIDSFNRYRSRLQPTAKGDTRPRANSIEEAVRRGQRQVEQARIKLNMQMDDKTFQTLLAETQVMITKDHTKWSFDTMQDLIDGPLHNAKRMEEAIKASRYIRKLMSFFHPFNRRFCDLPNTKANHRWVRLGCALLNALMSSPDGIRFLQEDEFLSLLVKGFAQLDPLTPTVPDLLFSKKRVQETLTAGYFEMIGTLSKRQEGIELLEKFKLFTAFYHLTELRSREDLVKGIIENLDYSIDGHSRIVLSKALTSVYKHVRHYATNYLGGLIRNSQTANAWMLRLLLTQLYDPALEVRELAVRFLEEACESTDVLQTVVEMQPTIDHLGEIGHPLLLKFMSTPTGFRFLYAADYIDREMELWFHERNLHYVVHIEVFLAKAFGHNASDEDEDSVLAFEGIVPPHFYGVMAKTELGCEVLQEKGHFAEFSHFIRRHGLESEDQEVILKLKSILWAVGNIGATERGLPFLEEEEIIPAILEIAEQSLVLSVRGTCFFVLGLISSTPQGAEILDDYHWEATLSPLGLPTGLCVPVDVDKFVSIPPWDCVTNEAVDDTRLAPPDSDEELEVMTAIYNLANTVIANTASRSLTKMKSKPEYRHIFSSPSMFYRALHTISSQKYKLPVRRYIFDLFNIDLDVDVIRQLSECSISLRIPLTAQESAGAGSSEPSSPATAQAHPPPPFRPMPVAVADSDEEKSDVEEEVTAKKRRAPVMSLRPKSRIIGFT
ncbi:hypothetical protein C8Q77DRAFT_1158732 [Trametes polyzona]|nr:hypothetical protein C8Q77DRAFT_1158732 [Trametes polyzona]